MAGAADLDIFSKALANNNNKANTAATPTEPEQKSKHYPRTALAYIAQLEHEYLLRHKLTVCNHCLALAINLAPPQQSLKQCVGCKLVDYCGRDCQKGDWKRHKAVCWMVQGKGDKTAWLEAVWKNDSEASGGEEGVYRRLIDAYRLRVVTDYQSRDEAHGLYWKRDHDEGKAGQADKEDKEGKEWSLVWAQGDVLADFQRWLDLCEESGVLPRWWAWENRMQCLLRAVDRTEKEGKDKGSEIKEKESDDRTIYTVINQENLIQQYDNDTSIRNALGILAELVVGYDGKGRATDDKWYLQFQEFMDLHPQERLRLIQGTIDAVEGVKGEHGELFAGKEQKEKKTE